MIGQAWCCAERDQYGECQHVQPEAAPAGRSRSFIADVLHDCISSFQGLDHSEGVCCFDRDAAVEYLLSEASGLSITLVNDSTASCFCGQPDDRERVHRAHECAPWLTDDASGQT